MALEPERPSVLETDWMNAKPGHLVVPTTHHGNGSRDGDFMQNNAMTTTKTNAAELGYSNRIRLALVYSSMSLW